jgi:hypothetical protein
MPIDFQIVVSCENSSYMSWQAQLICFSALSRLGLRPLLVVHTMQAPLNQRFVQLQKLGFPVSIAPSFATTPTGDANPPRNTIGTLLHLTTTSHITNQHILLCDADLLFVRHPIYEGAPSAEFYSYLDYEQPLVSEVIKRIGNQRLMPSTLSRDYPIGVPYLLPVSLIKEISFRWLAIMNLFRSPRWEDVMYAFGIALADLGISLKNISFQMDHNYESTKPLRGSVIHYCYSDRHWNKRKYLSTSPLDTSMSSETPAPPGSILEEILSQLAEAREYFRYR